MMKLPKRRNKLPILWTVLLAATVVAGGVVYSYLAQKSENLQPVVTQRPLAQDESGVVKDEQRFAPLSEQPVRLVIDKINVDAKIEPVGLTPEGLMDAPATNEGVGWYDQSARAGEADFAMLLDGHYGVESPGVFRHLNQLQLDDTLKVYGDGGAVLRYKVVETLQQRIEEVDMRKALYPYREGVQSLTIITCEGEFDAAAATYDKRTVLYAERIE